MIISIENVAASKLDSVEVINKFANINKARARLKTKNNVFLNYDKPISTINNNNNTLILIIYLVINVFMLYTYLLII